jgi:energy-coupling factor transporter ATP-binding protein EcfA2
MLDELTRILREVELGPFLRDVASHLSASFVERSLGILGRMNLISTRAIHRRELREKVKDMPFIYRDLEGDVANDFVDPDLRALSIESLSPEIGLLKTVDDRIRERKRILVLGNAGIGKTTFLRYEILLLLNTKGQLKHYMDKERLLPFYVPLKAVDGTKEYPILNYLLENNRYLEGGGLKRLTVLAKDQELFLFLDGYDEVEIGSRDSANSSQDHISLELRYFLQSEVLRENLSMSLEYREFYAAAQQCRIWISSRKEFFQINPIQLEDVPSINQTHGAHHGIKRAAAVQLAGIGRNRGQLANNIFDKYRNRSKKYNDVLSAEFFLQEIDRSPDQELVGLSYNPLFFTVMAYIYAEKAVAAESFQVTIGQTLPQLILECISLLLSGIDKQKARIVPLAQNAAFLRRRGDYIDEKKDFLYYFASRLLY